MLADITPGGTYQSDLDGDSPDLLAGAPTLRSGEARFDQLAAQLDSVVAELAESSFDSMVESEMGDALVNLLRRSTQLEAVITKLAARVDSSKIWSVDRSRTCAAWLARRAGRDRAECAQLVRMGRALRSMPHTDAAFSQGQLSARHVRLLAKAAAKAPENFPADEAILTKHARELTFDDFVVLINHWIYCAGPNDAEDEARRRYRNRSLNLSRGLDGTGLLDVEFEPIGFETFKNALARIEHELWEADWAEARKRLGEAATADDLARTSTQRRYDALVEMANRSMAMPQGARKPAPLITVHVDYETVAGRLCELSSGAPITPGEVLPLLTKADVERAVFDSAGRVINLGRRRRFFRGGAQRAVQVRDRYCVHPGCRVPADYCQVDHVIEWDDGGRTDHVNGQLLCPAHHRSKSKQRRQSGPRSRKVPEGDDPS